jgi:hypothetical protein
MAAFSEEKKLEISGLFLTSLALFPILRPAFQSILIGLFTAVTLWLYWPHFLKTTKDSKAIVAFLMLTGYYIWHVITFLWSDDMVGGLKDLQYNLLLLLFPFLFVFFHPKPNKRTLIRIQWTFIGAMVIFSYIWFQSYIEGISLYQELKLNEPPIGDLPFIEQLPFLFEKGYYWVSGISIRGYRIAEIENKMFLHHAYLAAYFLLAWLFSIKLFFTYKSIGIKVLLSLTALLSLAFIYYLPSTANKFIFIITTPIVLYYYGSKKVAYIFLIIALFAAVFTGMKYQKNFSNFKWVEKENLQSKNPVVVDFYRYHIYSCAKTQLTDNFIFGMGAPDMQPYLNACLPEDQWPGLYETKLVLNTHSQFLHYFLSGGIIGLLLFLILWFKLFSWAITKNQHMLLVILLIVLSNSIFENFLFRVWGAFFFVYFIFIFIRLPFIPNSLHDQND